MILYDRSKRHEEILQEGKSIQGQTERDRVGFDESDEMFKHVVFFFFEKALG